MAKNKNTDDGYQQEDESVCSGHLAILRAVGEGVDVSTYFWSNWELHGWLHSTECLGIITPYTSNIPNRSLTELGTFLYNRLDFPDSPCGAARAYTWRGIRDLEKQATELRQQFLSTTASGVQDVKTRKR